jgi:hypothetical protein
VFVFDANSGNLEFCDKGGPDEIFDITFNMAEGRYDLWTGGKKHMYYWNIAEGGKKRCIFGD